MVVKVENSKLCFYFNFLYILILRAAFPNTVPIPRREIDEEIPDPQ